jgi:hypothetical protein
MKITLISLNLNCLFMNKQCSHITKNMAMQGNQVFKLENIFLVSVTLTLEGLRRGIQIS